MTWKKVSPQRVAAIFQKELIFIMAIQKQELYPIDDVVFDDLEKTLKIQAVNGTLLEEYKPCGLMSTVLDII